jgi:hypothetical protein
MVSSNHHNIERLLWRQYLTIEMSAQSVEEQTSLWILIRVNTSVNPVAT